MIRLPASSRATQVTGTRTASPSSTAGTTRTARPRRPVVRDVSVFERELRGRSLRPTSSVRETVTWVSAAVLHFGTEPTFNPADGRCCLRRAGMRTQRLRDELRRHGSRGSARRSGQGSARGSPMTSSDARRSRSRSRPSFPVGTEHERTFTGVSPTRTSPSRRTCRGIRRPPGQAQALSST